MYVKNNVLRFRKFAVAVHPFIEHRVLFFRTCRAYTPEAPPTLLRRKLGGLPPGPAALLPRTRPRSNGINRLYGHGFYGNGYGNGFDYGYDGNGYGNGYGVLRQL